MINQLFKKTAETFNKETVSKPDVAPEPPKAATFAPEPKPIDQSPQALAERAAEAAGFVVNERYWGTTTKHKPQNKNLRWCVMDNWGEPVLFGVNNQDDWNPNEVIYGYYVKANGEGVLQFENRDGVRRNKWRRRP